MTTKNRQKLFRTGGYIIAVVLFLMFTIGPIVWSFIISITPQDQVMTPDAGFLPTEITFDNYKALLSTKSQTGILFRKGLWNSLRAALLSIAIGIPIATFSAYALSRVQFKGRSLIRNALLVTMVIPVFATITPLYKIYAHFNVLDNLFSLVLVYVTAFLPLTVWLISGYFITLPKEIEEAAYVDGCSKIKTMLKVIIPISYNIIFAAMLIIFLTVWNQYLIPLILAPSNAVKPIAVVASEFVTKSTVDYGLMNAGGILAILPPALIAIIFRKFLVKGMVGGATKG